jgi:PKD repeat protein
MKLFFISIIFIILPNFLYSTIIDIPKHYSTIQAGIDASANTDTVLVQPGTYVENIDYKGKLITLGSLFLTTQDTSYISSTIIDGNAANSVVRFYNGEDSTAVLSGFTLRNGDTTYGGGFYCFYSDITISNSIILNNAPYEIYNYGNSSNIIVSYSDVYGGWAGEGNISINPLFETPWDGNYYLQPTSPCIDAGDPNSPNDPDGTIVDMGWRYYYHLAPPMVEFSSDILSGYSPLTVNFTDLTKHGSGVLDEWYWDFGDGSNSSLQDPVHEYKIPGIYSVSLQVTADDDSTNIETKTDLITVLSADNPESPSDFQINISGDDAVLTWSAVDSTSSGLPTNVDSYIVYGSTDPKSEFTFLGVLENTSFTQNDVVKYSDRMFYKVIAYNGDLKSLQRFIAEQPKFKLSEFDLFIEEKKKR